MVVVPTVLALGLAGCGAGGDPPNAPPETAAGATTTGTTPSAAPTAATVAPTPSATKAAVPPTLAFSATTVDGKPFNAGSVAGKPVVLWFWAAWCPRCRAAAPNVAALQRDFDGKVTVLGVAGLKSGADSMRQFVSDVGIGGFTNLADDEGVIWRKFGVTTQEYFVLIDASGAVVHKGTLSGQALKDRVSAMAG